MTMANKNLTNALQDAQQSKRKSIKNMMYLLFDVRAQDEVVLNDEWVAHEWKSKNCLGKYDLNEATVKTFRQKEWI